uniref:Holin n=1 Tax=Myoviridae sp. ctCo31 TaxID=2825053 RepID=A0A8S5UMX7_9CAUD|nr:MAG TPA: holin [Myoviridae sp. ctCo31]
MFLYNQQDALVSVWRESRLENVVENIHKKRVEEYPATAKEQVQI